MKIKLLGKNLDGIRPLIAKLNMHETSGTPDLIITYGGDGALLGAERDFPEIPKLPLRDTPTAPTCGDHYAEKVLADFLNGKLEAVELPKLCADAPGGTLSGINDLVIHSAEYTSALRYRVFIDGELYAPEVLGDGVCFAGVHGSTAYYRSITRGIFKLGVGLAFSNSTEAVDHLVLPETSCVTVEILRGPGVLMADNDPRKIQLNVGEKVTLKQSGKSALIWGLSGFMCPRCRHLRHRSLSANEKQC
jgi:NAD+ kinase